jgi:hypothetical protein
MLLDGCSLVDQRAVLRSERAGLCMHRFEYGLRGSQLRTAAGQLRGEMRKLRLQMEAQFFNGVFQPVIGGDLLGLAHLHGLEIGQDDVNQEPDCGCKGIVHEEILRSI